MRDLHINNLRYSMRGKVYDEDTMHDIKDFEIIDDKNNKFISHKDDMEFCLKDFQYFIIYGTTLEQIIKDLCREHYERGLKDSKKKEKPEKQE